MGRRNGRVTDNSLFFHRISGLLIIKGGKIHRIRFCTLSSSPHISFFVSFSNLSPPKQHHSKNPGKVFHPATEITQILHQGYLHLSSTFIFGKTSIFFFFFGFEVLGHHKASSRKVLLQTVLRCLGALFPAFSVLHDCPLVSSWPSSWLLSSFRCKTLFSLSITLLWNFERDADEGLLVGPSLFVPVGLLGGLMAPGEMGSMDVLDAYLEFLWDMW